MRTNIVLNDKLVKEAFRYSEKKTKKDLIDEALRLVVQRGRRRSLLEVEGKVEFRSDYDYKKLRAGR